MDENLWFYHSNETSSVVPSLGWDQGPTSLSVGKRGNTCNWMQKKSARQWKGEKGGRAWGKPLMLTMVSCSDWSNISNDFIHQ